MHADAHHMFELGSLVRRDHDDLHYALRVMTEPLSDEAHVVEMLDRVRATFPAHVEAQTMALNLVLESQPPPALYFLTAQVIAAHLAQETALDELVKLRPLSPAFRERARFLRHMMVHHAEHEAACLHPALPDHVPRTVFRSLGTTYSSERDRLFVLHTSAAQLRNAG